MPSRIQHVIEGVDLDKAFGLTPDWIREHPEQIMDQLVHYVPGEVLASLGVTLDWICQHPQAALRYLRTYQPANTLIFDKPPGESRSGSGALTDAAEST